MEENLKWLFGAFAFGWAMLFGYLMLISAKERSLRHKVDTLEAALRERLERRG